MIACVSPALTVRSTPRRISRAPLSVSTETCRSRISRVVIRTSLSMSSGCDGHQDVVAVDLHGVDGHGLGGGEAGRPAGNEIEPRAVQPALDRLALDLTLGEGDVRMRAHVVD